MTTVPPMSPCVGDYDEGDVTCDGDGGEELPCGWRDRCAAFHRHLQVTGEDIEKYVKSGAEVVEGEQRFYAVPVDGEDVFTAFCDKLLKAEAKLNKKKKRSKKAKRRDIEQHDKRRDGPVDAAKKAAKKALKRRAHKRRGELMVMFDAFKTQLMEHIDGWEFATAGQVVAPGYLFVVDRLDSSGYLSVYCKAATGWNAPLIMLRFRSASLTFDARLPVDVPVLKKRMSKSTYKKLAPTSVVDGRFKSEALRIGKVELGLLAEAIAQLVDGGTIVLPAA